MTKNINIAFCGDLIAHVGDQLLDKSKRGERAQNWDGMFQQFMKDMADWLAGSQITREAGGMVTDIEGYDLTRGASSIIAGNPVIHQKLRTEL
jgi:hypothetical protein